MTIIPIIVSAKKGEEDEVSCRLTKNRELAELAQIQWNIDIVIRSEQLNNTPRIDKFPLRFSSSCWLETILIACLSELDNIFLFSLCRRGTSLIEHVNLLKCN